MAALDKRAPGAPRSEALQTQAKTQAHTQPSTEHAQNKSTNKPRNTPFHQLYAEPVPLRTFPLPSFYPNNPLSLFHVLWEWTKQVLTPPLAEPSVIHQGHWSPETRSVHIRDAASIRALWEQGFFGKGSYSRSEPNWFKREQTRQGQGNKKVSEVVTVQRREERKIMKWDRARKEQKAILKTRLEEARVAPVGPKELLALPNSLQDLQLSMSGELANGHTSLTGDSAHLATKDRGVSAIVSMPLTIGLGLNGKSNDDNGGDIGNTGTAVFNTVNDHHTSPPSTPTAIRSPTTLRRVKSVRFSPTVESTTFHLGDPPSPHLSSSGKKMNGDVSNKDMSPTRVPKTSRRDTSSNTTSVESHTGSSELIDREHLQLSPEEAFYLVFALGALSVTQPSTGNVLATRELFDVFLGLSSGAATLSPDNPFLIQYAVYHHFRSLGWVPRSGIKFGVDWLLYIGGPVFSHAEFAVIVLPAYTDPYWKSHGHSAPKRSWHWLHSVNRVQSHALKTMVMVYVDIPPPSQTQDPSALLKGYKIREFSMKRWLINRSR